MITIIDYDVGNLKSIKNMLRKLNFETTISRDPDVIRNSERLILPGVGAFDHAMNNLQKFDLVQVLNETVLEEEIPILGICLGMQIMAKKSEEGVLSGLSWFDAEVVRFNFNEIMPLKVPHMGWDSVRWKSQDLICSNCLPNSKYYFVHSYYVKCKKLEDVLGETCYGIEFPSAIKKNKIYGVQFHPEKSLKYGMNVLKNFAECV